jgi:hypothetical protein
MEISAVELDDNDVVEIFVTAMEGGIGYWAVADSYKWMHLYDEHLLPGISLGDDYVLAVLSDTEGDDFKDLKLTPFVIRRGVNWVLHHRPDLINIMDIDATAADAIVQAGLFDEIVYG